MSPELRDDRRFSRSGSVPNLAGSKRSSVHNHGSPGPRGSKRHHREMRNRSLITRMTRETPSGLLHPGMLQFHRQALSVEENGPYSKWVCIKLWISIRIETMKLNSLQELQWIASWIARIGVVRSPHIDNQSRSTWCSQTSRSNQALGHGPKACALTTKTNWEGGATQPKDNFLDKQSTT